MMNSSLNLLLIFCFIARITGKTFLIETGEGKNTGCPTLHDDTLAKAAALTNTVLTSCLTKLSLNYNVFGKNQSKNVLN